MSAYIVSKAHIDALVTVAMDGPRGNNRRDWRQPSFSWTDANGEPYSRTDAPDGADCLGAMLWLENQKSVAYRYPEDADGAWAGPVGLMLDDIRTYRHVATPMAPRLSAVEALKAIDCLEYQSCEHPGWKDSAARRFCDDLRGALIHALPGYEEADWEISD